MARETNIEKRSKDLQLFRMRMLCLMREHDLTVREVSERTGLGQSFVNDLARGARGPGWETACKLARLFGVTPNDFWSVS